MGLSFPVIAWGSAEDVNAWTSFGTPIITTGQADPFGGTGAVLIEDNDAVSVEGKLVSLGVYNGTSMFIVAVARAGTAAASLHLVRDTTVGVSRGGLTFTWSGGVPAVTATLGAALYGVAALGAGWYAALGQVTGLVAGNVHERRCYGATSSGDVGSTYWYLRNLVLLDALQGPPRVWDSIRPGSTKVVGPDGGYDSWITGRYYRIAGRASCIPSKPRSSPLLVSGWEGLNEAVGVNCGVQAMLRAGQNAQTLTFVPDRSDCATNIPSELVKPFEDEEGPVTLLNGDREFDLELRNTTTPYPSPL